MLLSLHNMIWHTGSWPKEQMLINGTGTQGGLHCLQQRNKSRTVFFDLALQRGLDVNEAGPYGRTSLSFAAEHGSEHKVRSLLKRNADYPFSRYGKPSTCCKKPSSSGGNDPSWADKGHGSC
jgi:ankyrin repeat protein